MKKLSLLFVAAALSCGTAPETAVDARPNILLIAVDDLRPELASFGASYIHSPNIDRLVSSGRGFRRHYVQAPTCGASRYTLLTGRYGGASNAALFERAARLKDDPESVTPSMPAWFRQHGYTTVSVGKVSHHPGGRGGADWDDPLQLEMPDSWDRHLLPAGPWQHPRGWMHGLADGEIRVDAADMDVFQAKDGPDSIYPDGGSIDEAVRQLDMLTSDSGQPFFLAVGILRPHLPFGAPLKYLKPYADIQLPPTPHPTKPAGRTTWHPSNEFRKYNLWNRDPDTDAAFALEVRRHYAACVTYADAQVGRLLERLDQSGTAEDTIVLLWGDHGWHLGEHAIWGKHALYEESLRSPLVISYPDIPNPGVLTDALVETLDVFPTLCDLAGLPEPEFVEGVSLGPILDDPTSIGHPAISYRQGAQTIRTETHRLILHDDRFAELYDHTSPEKESVNVASANAPLVAALTQDLRERLGQ